MIDQVDASTSYVLDIDFNQTFINNIEINSTDEYLLNISSSECNLTGTAYNADINTIDYSNSEFNNISTLIDDFSSYSLTRNNNVKNLSFYNRTLHETIDTTAEFNGYYFNNLTIGTNNLTIPKEDNIGCNFNDDNIGDDPNGWETTEVGTGNVEVAGLLDGHHKIVNLTGTDVSNTGQTVYAIDGNQSGIVEFYVYFSDASEYQFMAISDSGLSTGLIFGVATGYFLYLSDSYPAGNIIASAVSSQWYHIKLFWDIDHGWNVTINLILYDNSGSNYDYKNEGAIEFDQFQILTGLYSSSRHNTYIDAVDFGFSDGYFPLRSYYYFNQSIYRNDSNNIYEKIVDLGGHNEYQYNNIEYECANNTNTSVMVAFANSTDNITYSSFSSYYSSNFSINSHKSRYIKFRVKLNTTNIFQTPNLTSFALNYSTFDLQEADWLSGTGNVMSDDFSVDIKTINYNISAVINGSYRQLTVEWEVVAFSGTVDVTIYNNSDDAYTYQGSLGAAGTETEVIAFSGNFTYFKNVSISATGKCAYIRSISLLNIDNNTIKLYYNSDGGKIILNSLKFANGLLQVETYQSETKHSGWIKIGLPIKEVSDCHNLFLRLEGNTSYAVAFEANKTSFVYGGLTDSTFQQREYNVSYECSFTSMATQNVSILLHISTHYLNTETSFFDNVYLREVRKPDNVLLNGSIFDSNNTISVSNVDTCLNFSSNHNTSFVFTYTSYQNLYETISINDDDTELSFSVDLVANSSITEIWIHNVPFYHYIDTVYINSKISINYYLYANGSMRIVPSSFGITHHFSVRMVRLITETGGLIITTPLYSLYLPASLLFMLGCALGAITSYLTIYRGQIIDSLKFDKSKRKGKSRKKKSKPLKSTTKKVKTFDPNRWMSSQVKVVSNAGSKVGKSIVKTSDKMSKMPNKFFKYFDKLGRKIKGWIKK